MGSDDAANELLGGEAERLIVRSQGVHLVGTGSQQQVPPLTECGQSGGRQVRVECREGVRLEGQGGDLACGAEPLAGAPDEGGVPDMDAVEGADCKGGGHRGQTPTSCYRTGCM